MTEMRWYKRFSGTAYDPKFTVAGEEARSTHCNALGVWDALLETTSENEEDRGSLATVDLRVVAAGLHLAVDEIQRIWEAFISLGMIAGKRIAKWVKRQGAGVAKVAKAVSTGAQRMRRYRRQKAEDVRQAKFDFAETPPHEPAEGVTSGVTGDVTSAAEKEGRAQSPKTLSTESLKGVEGFKNDEGGSYGRKAPLAQAEPSDKIVNLSDSPALKARKKEARRQKVFRFILARFTGDELTHRMNGMMGLDEMRDEQWWFDKCDAERRLVNWDDVRDRERSMPQWKSFGVMLR